MSFNLRSLNVVLSLITRCLNSSNHPQLVRMFYNIKNIVNIYVSIKSININALLLTILIYRIEVYFLRVSTCIIFYGFVGNLRSPLELLPTLTNYCQLLPTFYCQLDTSTDRDLILGNIYPFGSVHGRLLYKFPTVHFEINPLFSSSPFFKGFTNI